MFGTCLHFAVVFFLQTITTVEYGNSVGTLYVAFAVNAYMMSDVM